MTCYFSCEEGMAGAFPIASVRNTGRMPGAAVKRQASFLQMFTQRGRNPQEVVLMSDLGLHDKGVVDLFAGESLTNRMSRPASDFGQSFSGMAALRLLIS